MVKLSDFHTVANPLIFRKHPTMSPFDIYLQSKIKVTQILYWFQVYHIKKEKSNSS